MGKILKLKSDVDYQSFKLLLRGKGLSYKAFCNLWKELSTGVLKERFSLITVENIEIYEFEYCKEKYCYFPTFWFEEVKYSDIEWE